MAEKVVKTDTAAAETPAHETTRVENVRVEHVISKSEGVSDRTILVLFLVFCAVAAAWIYSLQPGSNAQAGLNPPPRATHGRAVNNDAAVFNKFKEDCDDHEGTISAGLKGRKHCHADAYWKVD